MKHNEIPNNECIPALMKGRKSVWDGDGLQIIHGKVPGRFYWRFSFLFNGRRNTLSVGVYPEVDLEGARTHAVALHSMVRAGEDPSVWRASVGRTLEQKQRATKEILPRGFAKDSFRASAIRWIDLRKSEWSSGYTEKVQGRIDMYLLPVLGKISVRLVSASEVTKLCLAIQQTGRIETGLRCLTICRRILDLCVAEGFIKNNPCTSVPEALKTPIIRNFPAVTEPIELAQLLKRISNYGGTEAVKIAFQLKAMLMVRGAELRKAEWCEFDLEMGEWRIPPVRMKGRMDRKMNGDFHRVPLPSQAILLLKDWFQSTGRSKYVFPSASSGDGCMSANTLNRALRIMGYCTKTKMTAHGFRATARTMIVERLGWDKDVVERQLAHTVTDQNGTAYNRTQHYTERRKMLQAWADYLDDLRNGRQWEIETIFVPITQLSFDPLFSGVDERAAHRPGRR